MEHYWKTHILVPRATPEYPPAASQDGGDLITSEYDCLWCSYLHPDIQDDGWETKIHQYLKDFTQYVMKDTEIVTRWKVRE